MDAIDFMINKSKARLKRADELVRASHETHVPTDEEVYRFYHSKEWKATRLTVLHRDYGNDQIELREQHRILKGNTVHHIHALRDHWSLRLEPDNLETVSPINHNVEHPEKGMNPRDRKSFKQKQARIEKHEQSSAVVKVKKNIELG